MNSVVRDAALRIAARQVVVEVLHLLSDHDAHGPCFDRLRVRVDDLDALLSFYGFEDDVKIVRDFARQDRQQQEGA